MKKILSLVLVLMITIAALVLTSCEDRFKETTESPKEQVRTTITEEEWNNNTEKKNFTVNLNLNGTYLNMKMTEDVLDVVLLGEHILVDRANKMMYYDTGIGWCAYISEIKYDEMYIDLGDVLEGLDFSKLEYDEVRKAYLHKEIGFMIIFNFENGELVGITYLDSANSYVVGEINDIGTTEVDLPSDYLVVDDGSPTPSKADEEVRTVVTNDEWEYNMVTSYTVKLFSPLADIEMKCDGDTFVQRLNAARDSQLEYYTTKDGIIYKLEYEGDKFVGKEVGEGSLPNLNDLIASIIQLEMNQFAKFTYNEDGRYYEHDGTYLYFEDGILVKIVQIEDKSEIILLVSNLGNTKITVPTHEIEIKGPIYTLNTEGTGYIVSGMGKIVDRDVVIPEIYNGKPVVAIGDEAFRGCSSITSITIPNTVISIGANAFYGCDSLKYNEYDNALYLGNDGNPHLVLVKAKNKNITSCEINIYTRFICNSAFEYCRELKSIVIPDSVTSIGNVAFGYCYELSSVTISNSVINMGNAVFSECSSLIYNVYDNVSYLGNDENPRLVLMKVNDDSITSFEINSNTRFIYAEAFKGCRRLENITIPTSIVSIGSYAFQHCSSLVSVTMPDSVKDIGHYTFSSCTKLESIVLSNSITSIGQGVFENCYSLTSVNIPNSVEIIHHYAFYGCSALTKIVIPDSVTRIVIEAFYGCKSLTIYCEAKSVPAGWDYRWNHSSSKDIPVVWGYKGE